MIIQPAHTNDLHVPREVLRGRPNALYLLSTSPALVKAAPQALHSLNQSQQFQDTPLPLLFWVINYPNASQQNPVPPPFGPEKHNSIAGSIPYRHRRGATIYSLFLSYSNIAPGIAAVAINYATLQMF